MASTNPLTTREAIRRYGWEILPYLGNLGINLLANSQLLFVDSGSTNASDADDYIHGHTPDKPLATLDYAIGLCTANQGDVIILLPGHAENVASAGAITFDVAGVSVIGVGTGSKRPTFTFITATTADIEVDAANNTIKNCVFKCDIDALAAPIDVDAAGFTMEDCDFIDLGTDNTVRWILGDANADDMTIKGCRNYGTATAGNTAWITLNGADHVTIKDCVSEGDFDAANIETVTAACTDLLIDNCVLENANAVDVNIEGFAAQTGWVRNCSCRIATDAQVTWINTGGSMSLFENYGVNNNGETGLIIGTVSA